MLYINNNRNNNNIMQKYNLYTDTNNNTYYDQITAGCDYKALNTFNYVEVPPEVIIRQDGHIITNQVLDNININNKEFIINKLLDKYTLIGLAGPATVGKSFLADKDFLLWEKYSIATRLKKATMNFIIANFGNKKYKELLKDKEAIRPFYNKVGEMMRIAQPGYYIKDLEVNCDTRKIVVDDVATNDEILEIQRLGGIVIWLDRVGDELIQSTRPCPDFNKCNYFVDLGKK